MNYLKIYLHLIRKAEKRGWDKETSPVITESHHIFPRSIYGEGKCGMNKRCVHLTLREHYIAHALLMKGFIQRYGPDHIKSVKMIYAFHMMNIMRDKIGYPNSYLYESSRTHYVNMRIGRKRKPFSPEHIEKLRQRGLGENNPFYGKKHTEESKEKQRLLMVGRYDGKKNPFYGKSHSEETKKKMSAIHKGKIISQEQIHLMRELFKDTIFINNGTINKRIKKDQPIPEGWIMGKIKNNEIWISNGVFSKRIKKDQPIPEGWVRGRITKRSKSLINNSSK